MNVFLFIKNESPIKEIGEKKQTLIICFKTENVKSIGQTQKLLNKASKIPDLDNVAKGLLNLFLRKRRLFFLFFLEN